MSAATAKKPPVPGRDPMAPSSSPSRAPPRSSTPTATSSTPAAGGAPVNHTRSRSFRSGPPVSARAAAGQRRESPLAAGGSNTGNMAEVEESARAETVAVMDDLKDRLAKAEIASEEYRKQAEVLQAKFDDVTKEHIKFEEKVHEGEEQIEALKNEKREATRKIREMEAIYEAERGSMVREKEDMANREEEMQTVIQRLKDTLNAKMNEDESRPSRQPNSSPSIDGGSFAPPASLQRSDSRNNSKLILQKDKLIESLRLELAEAQIKLVESENQGGGRLHEVERLLMEARMANARLMEDNESYQLLLQEKTLNGDFGKSDFSYMGGAQANEDALAALEGKSGGASLADELNEAAEGEVDSENYRRLEAELRSMKDQNKALTLYINRIIERLLEHQDFEHILDQSDSKTPGTNKELPPPPPPKDTAAAAPARAQSMAAPPPQHVKPRPRPMSVVPTAANMSAYTNGGNVPNLPIGLGRTQSTRNARRPHSEQYTGAASVVNQMYKGPDGPLSPGLRNSQGFFRERNVSGATSNSVPMTSSGNFPGMGSQRSSMSGDSTTPGDSNSPPSQSPPREKKTQTFAAGNKPRPLRLVQENPDAGGQANKRQSWIGGWFSGNGAKKESAQEVVSPRESTIRE